MTANRSRRTGRPRLDPGERERLLAEIAKLDETSEAPSPITSDGAAASLRTALTKGLAPDTPIVTPQPPAQSATPAPLPTGRTPNPARRERPAQHTPPLRQEAHDTPQADPARSAVAQSQPAATPQPAEPAHAKAASPAPEPRIAPEPSPGGSAPDTSPKPPTPAPAPNEAASAKPEAPLVLTPAAAPAEPDHSTENVWATLPTLTVEPGLLDRNLVITARRSDPAHGAFDVLRTRLVQALAEKGWTRVAITSPTAGCGKSFTAINLAVTLSRYDQCRTVLMDMDMRRPGLAGYLGVRNPASTGDFLRGQTPLANYLTRMESGRLNIGRNLALGLNSRAEAYAAELFQQQSTATALADLQTALNPEVMLFDLPPALAQDDVIAFRPHFDCVLMVVGGGITTAEDVREATRRIGEDKPVLGVVLNKAEVEGDYAY